MDGGRIDGFINPVFCYVPLDSTQPTEMLIIRIMAEDLTTKRADEVFLDVMPDAAGLFEHFIDLNTGLRFLRVGHD